MDQGLKCLSIAETETNLPGAYIKEGVNHIKHKANASKIYQYERDLTQISFIVSTNKAKVIKLMTTHQINQIFKIP